MTSNPRNPDDPNATGSAQGSGGDASADRAAQNAAPSAGRVIKRYSNRKLYDTVESRYVTLPQIAQLVRKGEDVRIIDNNTKEDLTSVTLAQILYEEERRQSRALPLTALKDLIHTSGEKIISTLREGPMGKLMGGKPGEGGVGTTTEPAVTVPAPASSPPGNTTATGEGSPSGSPGRLYEMFEQSRVSVQEWQHRVDERVRKVLEAVTPASQVEKLQAEVRKLTQRVEELEAKLGQKSE